LRLEGVHFCLAASLVLHLVGFGPTMGLILGRPGAESQVVPKSTTVKVKLLQPKELPPPPAPRPNRPLPPRPVASAPGKPKPQPQPVAAPKPVTQAQLPQNVPTPTSARTYRSIPRTARSTSSPRPAPAHSGPISQNPGPESGPWQPLPGPSGTPAPEHRETESTPTPRPSSEETPRPLPSPSNAPLPSNTPLPSPSPPSQPPNVIPDKQARPSSNPPNALTRPVLRKLGIKTLVRLLIKCHPDGHIEPEIVVSTGSPELDQAVLNDLRNWRWEPAEVAGRPVYSERPIKLTLEAE
jgi:hypothetical protein